MSVVYMPNAGTSPDAILKDQPIDYGMVDPNGKVYLLGPPIPVDYKPPFGGSPNPPIFDIGLPGGGIKRSVEMTGSEDVPVYTMGATQSGGAAQSSNLLPFLGLGLLAWFLLKK